MTPIEQIIEEFEGMAFFSFPPEVQRCTGYVRGNGQAQIYEGRPENIKGILEEKLSSLQESTESRVREELRAAVESRKILKLFHKECVSGKAEMCDPCNDYTIHNNALRDVQSLLQDPKKQ